MSGRAKKASFLRVLFNILFQRKPSNASISMSQQSALLQRPSADDRASWRDYWQQMSQPWRTEPEIDIQRQEYLTKRRIIVPDIEQGIYPFNGVKLSRADIEWLLATHENGRGPVDWSDERQRDRIGLDLRGAILHEVNLRRLPLARICGGQTLDEYMRNMVGHRSAAVVHLAGADLSSAYLEEAFLSYAHLEGAVLNGAYFYRADLSNAYLEGAFLEETHLEHANLSYAHLEKTDCSNAYFGQADLSNAHLSNAYLRFAHLEGANLKSAFLGGKLMRDEALQRVKKWYYGPMVLVQEWFEKDFFETFPDTLSPADLRGSFFDTATNLEDVILGEKKLGYALLTDIHWGGCNLSVVDWTTVNELSDKKEGDLASVRVNRQLATVLQEQGVSEDAAHFAYQAHVLHRKVLKRQIIEQEEEVVGNNGVKVLQKVKLLKRIKKFRSYVFSLFLDGIAGYGYVSSQIKMLPKRNGSLK